jgi:hypothetical protein
VTIWLFGDSIFRGSSTRSSKGLWPVRGPAPIIDLMLGAPTARLGGETAIPTEVAAAAARIQAMVERDIGPDDVIVMLDVGLHSSDPDEHERQWLQLRRATAAHAGLTIICEGFDNGAQGRRKLVHRKPIGARSPNDAVRAAATARLDQCGRTAFLPTLKPLARFHRWLVEHHGQRAYQADDVHLSYWGRGRLSWLILDACGLADGAAAGRWTDYVDRYWRKLGARSGLEKRSLAVGTCLAPRALYPAGPMPVDVINSLASQSAAI